MRSLTQWLYTSRDSLDKSNIWIVSCYVWTATAVLQYRKSETTMIHAASLIFLEVPRTIVIVELEEEKWNTQIYSIVPEFYVWKSLVFTVSLLTQPFKVKENWLFTVQSTWLFMTVLANDSHWNYWGVRSDSENDPDWNYRVVWSVFFS